MYAIIQVSSTIHGYEPAGYKGGNGTDVYRISCTNGWTCGNLVARTRDVARFFADLLGPLHNNNNDTRAAAAEQFQKGGIVSNTSLHAMTRFVQLDPSNVLRYGLGLMEMQYARSTALSLSLTHRSAAALHHALLSLTHTHIALPVLQVLRALLLSRREILRPRGAHIRLPHA